VQGRGETIRSLLSGVRRCFVFALLGLTSEAVAQSGAWETRAPMPTPRTLHALAAVNGKLYAVGGGFNLTVEAYDPVTDSWTTRASMPGPPRNQFASAVFNGKIYVIGGVVPPNIPLSLVQVYDPAADTWTTKANMPTPRWGHGVAVVNGELYAIAGSNDFGYPPLVEKYNPTTDSWTTIAGSLMPTQRQDFATAVLDGKIYTIGGFIGHTVVEVYDPATNSWSTKASIPTGKYYFGAVTLGNKIYAIGGSVGMSPTLAENHVYDPVANAWTALSSMPTARGGHGVEVMGGVIHVVGGTPEMVTQLGTHEVFSPILTPQQAIQNLISLLSGLGLAKGLQTSLAAPLNQALAILNDGNPNNDAAVCGKLGAFLNQLGAKDKGAQITAAQAAALRQSAEIAKTSLSCQ
jgi:N-acetylneuraminic acid mutarotase